jgi:putative flippase GtrA
MVLNSIFNFLKNPQIFKFLLIGFFNGIIVLFLTGIFTTYLDVFYVISALISYEISILSSFFMNDKWTFTYSVKTSKTHTRLIKYNAFSLIGMGLNALILIILTDYFEFHYLISQSVAILIVFSFNYTTSKKISFKN